MATNLYHPELMSYLERLLPDRPLVMQEMEAYAKEVNFPIIGAVAGQFLYQVARMIGARRIFELGSGYGYSTAWFAQAVRENGGGEVHHVVWDEGLSQKARDYLGRLGYSDVVHFHVSEAVAQLRAMEGEFDLMFNDIDKQGYPDSIAVIKPKLSVGGVLLIDNVLWSGRVLDSEDTDPQTDAIRRVTQMLFEDPDFCCTVLPLRDGVLMARKVG